MKRFFQILLLLLPLLAVAAEPVEQQLLDRLTTLRLQQERLADTQRGLAARRTELSSELNRLSVEIEREKLSRPLDGLLPSPGLENNLRRVKAISEELQQLSRTLQELDSARGSQSRELLVVLEKLIEAKTENLAALRQQERSQALAAVEKLRREYNALLQQMSEQYASGKGPLPMFEESEDAEQLREQADALSDARDKLRRRLAELDENIKQTRSQIRLERRLRQFIAAQELFGENRASPLGVTATGPKGGASETAPGDFLAGPQEGDGSRNPDVQQLSTPGSVYHQTTADGARPEDRLTLLDQQRQRLVEEIKKLQVQYDRLQEKLERLNK